MLEDYLRKHDIDIALLQEKTHPDLSTLRNYNAHINQGTEGRGTAILTKAELTVTNNKRLPSGGGIASIINGTWIINIYAPSGAEIRPRGKDFTPTTYHTSYQLQI
jgi:exonuclease III